MADYQSTAVLSAGGYNVGALSNVAELSDGSLVYLAAPVTTAPAANQYLYVYRSTDKGQSFNYHSKMRWDTFSGYSYASIAISANGMKIAIICFRSFNLVLCGMDFSIVPQGAIKDDMVNGGSGYWAMINLGTDSNAAPFSILFASDNNVYISYYFFHNYSSQDDEYHSYYASYTYGAASPVFNYWNNNDVSMYSTEYAAYTIVEYGGKVIFVSSQKTASVPLGTASLGVYGITTTSGPLITAAPHSDGFLYVLTRYSPYQYRLWKTNNVSASITLTAVDGAIISLSNTGYEILGMQIGQDNNIWIFYRLNALSTAGGTYVRVINTAGVSLGEWQLVANTTGIQMINGSSRQMYYNRFSSSLNTNKTVSIVTSFNSVGSGVTSMYAWTRSFNAAPNAPVGLTNGRGTWAWFNSNPTYSWTFSDPDGGPQGYWQLQRSSDNWATVDYDVGTVAGTANSHTIGWSNQGAQYVRVRTADPSGVWGPWSYDGYNVDTVGPTGNSSASTRYLNVAVGGTFRVQITGVADALSGIYQIQFPVWTSSNGQDDIRWYVGVNAGGGTWYFDVPIANHGNAEGLYLCDPYIIDNANNSISTGTIQTYVDRTAPATPTQMNGILYATSNGVSWSAFSDGANSSGLLLTTLTLQKWNGSTWVTESGFPKSVVGLTYSFTGLTPGTQYRWGVTYTDNASNTSVLNYTTFTTNTYAVSTINNLTSTGSILNQRPKFRITPTDANDSTLTDFQIQISTSNLFASTIIDATRSVKPSDWSTAAAVPSGTAIAYVPPSNLGTGNLYVRSRANDGKEWGTWSTAVSFTITAVSWVTTIAADDTAISKRTVDEIRTKVNVVRQARGLAPVVWTDSVITDWNGVTPTNIRTAHLIELRQAITDIYTALFASVPTWSTDPIIDTTINRKGQHWIDLRTILAAA
jgi:hypothetical protein